MGRLPVGAMAIAVLVAACTSGGGDGATTTLPPLLLTTTTAETSQTQSTNPAPSAAADTLGAVLSRGVLRCGVNAANAPGFTDLVDGEVVGGFDVEFCQAVAAAVFGDADRVDFVLSSGTDRWEKLDSGDIDVLFRQTTRTSGRDARYDFGPTTFHDGQRLMASIDDGFSPTSDIPGLLGATVCVNEGTTSELTINEVVAESGVELTIEPTPSVQDAIDRLVDGTCTAVTSDLSQLIGAKSLDEPEPNAWVLFPPIPLSKEPLAPVFRSGDSQWADIITWTVYAMIIADEKEITSVNVRDLVDARDIDGEAALLFGVDGSFASELGLASDAFLEVIEQVGNYDQVFRRNFNDLGITREGSLNASDANLGLIWAPPVKIERFGQPAEEEASDG